MSVTSLHFNFVILLKCNLGKFILLKCIYITVMKIDKVMHSLYAGLKMSYFIALQCTYLLKQSAIPLMTGRATNGLKVGNFPGRMWGAGSPEPAHSTGTTGVEMTGYVTTAQQIT